MRAPRFWDRHLDSRSREAAPLTRLLLTPFAALYAGVTERRIRNTEPSKLDIPVICVGNLTAGGSGKSPVAAALREHFSARFPDARIATLSRGYGGKLSGPLKVNPDIHTATEVGDESLMFSRSGEAWIGADRAVAGKAMQDDGVDLIIMDDGHQNPSLSKDLSLVVVDAHSGFGNGHVIPKGPLREPVTAGLSRADAIVLVGEGEPPEEIPASGLPVLAAHIRPTAPVDNQPLVAFAGIGRPEKFFDTLTDGGADLRDAAPFPDHHVFSEGDLSYLRSLASKNEARLITTEKDFVRLTASQRDGILTLPVAAQFSDTAALDKRLAPVAQRMRK